MGRDLQRWMALWVIRTTSDYNLCTILRNETERGLGWVIQPSCNISNSVADISRFYLLIHTFTVGERERDIETERETERDRDRERETETQRKRNTIDDFHLLLLMKVFLVFFQENWCFS